MRILSLSPITMVISKPQCIELLLQDNLVMEPGGGKWRSSCINDNSREETTYLPPIWSTWKHTVDKSKKNMGTCGHKLIYYNISSSDIKHRRVDLGNIYFQFREDINRKRTVTFRPLFHSFSLSLKVSFWNFYFAIDHDFWTQHKNMLKHGGQWPCFRSLEILILGGTKSFANFYPPEFCICSRIKVVKSAVQDQHWVNVGVAADKIFAVDAGGRWKPNKYSGKLELGVRFKIYWGNIWKHTGEKSKNIARGTTNPGYWLLNLR